MLFRTASDWKQLLSIEDEERLNEILKKVAKHRGAYKNADEIKMAQLWCAILELTKQNLILQKRLNIMEDIFEAVYEKQRKREQEERALIRSLEIF
jgi:arginine utilization protein RocB